MRSGRRACGPGGFTVTRMWLVAGGGSASGRGERGDTDGYGRDDRDGPGEQAARLRFLIFRPVSMAASTGAAPGSTAASAG